MPIDAIIEKILRGTAEIIGRDLLAKKLKSGKKLTVKAGFDPTAPDLHLGHVVLIRKLKQLQDLGHDVHFLIGDFTAMIGDPSGRDEARPQLDEKTIKENSKTFKAQIFKILDRKKTKIDFNSSWCTKLGTRGIFELTAACSVAQMLARADFKKRMEENNEIRILEFIYPLLQGYDSVVMQADIELGGTDQRFNLLMGRQMQEYFANNDSSMGKRYAKEPQVIIMTSLLEGTDGVKKMSKTAGNYIGITEPADEMFGKLMSISDDLMLKYFEFLTDMDLNGIRNRHPKEAKMSLGSEIVRQFHGDKAAKAAREAFERTFSQKLTPENAPKFSISRSPGKGLLEIMLESGLAPSKKEARRLLKQGSVSHAGQKLKDEHWKPQKGVLKVGKRRFLELY